LSFNNSVVYQSNERAKVLVVVSCQVEHLVFKVSLFFLDDDGLFLFCLALFVLLDILFFSQRTTIANLFCQVY